MSKGFGKSRPQKQSQKKILLNRLIVALKNMPDGFRRNFAASIWQNDLDSLTVYIEQLNAEAGLDCYESSVMIYHDRKLEKTIEQAIVKELKKELDDMR